MLIIQKYMHVNVHQCHAVLSTSSNCTLMASLTAFLRLPNEAVTNTFVWGFCEMILFIVEQKTQSALTNLISVR